MKNKVGCFVKTYNRCTGEISLGVVSKVLDRKVFISSWTPDTIFYADEVTETVPADTIIWDHNRKRWCYVHIGDDALNATNVLVLDCCEPEFVPYRMIIEGEKISRKY